MRLLPLTVVLLVAASLVHGDSTGLDVQGHRGCRGLRPENSLPAFRHALSIGVSTLELDLRITRDRVLVVHHDPRPNAERCVVL